MTNNIVSFDIGVRNFAMAWVQIVETIPVVRYMSHTDLSTGLVASPPTTIPTPTGKGLVHRWGVYRQLIVHLESLDWIFTEHRPIILIEQQMAIKHKMNVQALRLAQHVLAYFLHRHPSLIVYEYSARFKTEVFDYSPSRSNQYRDRKKWTVEKTREHLQGDPVACEWFQQFSKKDDVADCVVMCLAFHTQCQTITGKKKTGASVVQQQQHQEEMPHGAIPS